MIAKTLFVGIGSPHGDDQVGWQVADALAKRLQASRLTATGGDTASLDSLESCSDCGAGVSPADEQARRLHHNAGHHSGPHPPASLIQLAVRKAGSPVDVLDWMEGIERLIICDACRGSGLPGFACRSTWPDQAIELAHCSGSHDLGLAGVLKLAHRLERLPPVVIVWGMEADTLQPQDDLSAAVTARLPAVVDAIWSDLNHA